MVWRRMGQEEGLVYIHTINNMVNEKVESKLGAEILHEKTQIGESRLQEE